MSLSYIDDLRSRSWVGFAEVAILAPELLAMKRRERSHLEIHPVFFGAVELGKIENHGGW